MSVATRIIEYACLVALIMQGKELSLTILAWFTNWLKDGVLPVDLPPSGSLWLQNSVGMSWGTTGYYEDELDPFAKNPCTYEIWFRPGTRWLVIDCGESTRLDFWWIDVMKLKEKEDDIPTGKVRIFANRHAMQEWRRSGRGRMLRIDE